MNNNFFRPIGALVALSTICAPLTAEAAKKKNKKSNEKPNIIFLFTDQHRADVFSYAGHPDVQTPNFDKMAEGGMVFTRAYSQDAVSGPSRTSLFTGLYPRTTGQMDNGAVKTDPVLNCVSLQSTLQENGYRTYAFGKRHLHDAPDKGWTETRAHSHSENPNSNYVKWIEEQGYADEFGQDWAAEFGKYPPGNSLAGTKYPTAKMGTRQTKLPSMFTMEAYSARNTIETIRKHAKSGEPFFCFTSFYRPHQPYNPLPEYWAKHDKSKWGEGRNNGGAVAMPATLREPAENLTPFMKNLRGNEKGIWCLGLAEEDEQLYRDYITAYYALVEEIDYWVGEIFRELEENGMAENTIIIYSSDHGEFIGNHGMIEKAAAGHNVYEETLRVPYMFYWKDKIDGNRKSSDLVELLDIYPTLVELTGSKLPEMKYELQGLSLADALLKDKSVDREYTVSENWSQASIITKDSKLAIWLDPELMYPNGARDWRNSTNFLFYRQDDPTEVNNRYQELKDSDEVKKLEAYYAEFESKVPAIGKQEWMEHLKNKKKK
ncbi:MAG: sulfatase-like hydrolase/transferase [Rikenellaceae bacterium]